MFGTWVRGKTSAIALAVFIGAGSAASLARADYPGVTKFIPANPNTYIPLNRPHGADFIESVMIHDTEGRYDATVSAFTYPQARASAHYAVSGQDNSSDPAVTQFVHDKDGAKNVNNFWFNEHSIGVEHIGFAVAPEGFFTQRLYERSADLVGWALWKYRIPLDHAHILGHDNIPNSVGDELVQHWDPGPSWDWPYYMRLVRAAYERWSHGAPPPRAEIPARYTKKHRKIRMISVGRKLDSARDWFLWTTGHQNAFTNVYADQGGRPALDVLVRGASDPSTFIPSSTVGKAPTYDALDFSCDNIPWSIIPNAAFVLSQVSASDLRAKAAWGEEFALLDSKRVDGVGYDEINFSGTVGWVRHSDTSDGWGALVRFRGGSHPTTLYSGPEYPAQYLGKTLDTRMCPDAKYGFSRAGQTYVAQMRRFSQGRTWYQIDYNHRVAWVPEDEVEVSAR
jgi:N-acetyl-anhydromuramyl-L-alanine amidase AmpD